MIKEINHVCGTLNEKPGISVPLPNPGKKTLKTVSMCQVVVGVGLVTAGAVFSSKWCSILGGIGIINSIILHRESRNGKDEQ